VKNQKQSENIEHPERAPPSIDFFICLKMF